MSDERQQKIFRRLMASAALQTPADGPHFVDDDELLDRWTNRRLSPDEHESILNHLDLCSYCREVLTALLRERVLELPEVSANEDQESHSATGKPLGSPTERNSRLPTAAPVAKSPEMSATERRSRLRWTLAVAAGLIGLVGVIFVTGQSGNELAMAERELLDNQPAKALARLERLEAKGFGVADEARAKELVERAGYAMSGTALQSADYPQVEQTIERVSQLGVNSARLTNQRLQAARKVPLASSLSRDDTLLEYQYDLRGEAFGKSLPVLDEQTQRIVDQFGQALADYGQDLNLRLNFGQFLLTLGRAEESQQQFEAARTIDPDNAEVHLGLGLAAFERQDFERAGQLFVRAAELAPSNFAANLNAAICLDRLGQAGPAATHWQRAEELAADAATRALIAAHRQREKLP